MKKIFIISFLLLLVVGCDTKEKTLEEVETKEVEYTNIIYQEVVDNKPVYACISFKKDNTYSMYDCDSEPTEYFFDSENECTFKYDGTYIKFNCKHNYSNVKFNSIKILQWDKYTFRFMYGDEEKVFKSLTWIEENLKQETEEEINEEE